MKKKSHSVTKSSQESTTTNEMNHPKRFGSNLHV